MKFDKEYINSSAENILDDILRIIEDKWIYGIYDIYKEICKTSLEKFDVKVLQLTKEKYNRLYLEILSFSIFFSIIYSSKYFVIKKGLFGKLEPDIENKNYFKDILVHLTEGIIEYGQMNMITEIVIEQLEPELKFGFGENINFWKRVNEYAEVYFSDGSNGKEIKIFGDYIGMSLDPYNYPILSLIGGEYGIEITRNIIKIIDKYLNK